MRKISTLILICFALFAKADYWTQKADFGGTVRQGPVYFSIGTKGYIGIGTDTYPVYHFRTDFWEYDPATNIWTQKADFAGTARYTAICFSIGNKGYVGTGWDQVTPLYKDFWEYDQTNNTWTQKGNFPGVPRQSGVGFTINNIGYAGFGNNGSTILKDFYSYNNITDMWTQVAIFPGAARDGLFGIEINGKGYVGVGNTTYPANNLVNDVWEYDPTGNVWMQKANYPLHLGGTGFFSINNKGYVGMGGDGINQFNNFYEFDPIADTWTQKASYGVIQGVGIQGGFTIGSHGYTGCGYSNTLGNLKSFWEYTPDGSTGIEELPTTNLQFTISPNPAKDFTICSFQFTVNKKIELTVTDVQGKKVFETKSLTSDFRLPTSDFSKGIYFVEASDGKEKTVRKFVKE